MSPAHDAPVANETTLYSLRDHLLVERGLGPAQIDHTHQPGHHQETPRPGHPYNLPPIHHITAIPSHFPAPSTPYIDTRGHTSESYSQHEEERTKVSSPSNGKEDNETTVDPVTGKKVALSTTKRAQQNRAAQRAFRARKESHIKTLEDRLKSLEAVQSSYKQLTTENFELRAYISTLQSRLVEATGSCPPPPPAMNPSTAIDVRLSCDAGGRPDSAGPRHDDEHAQETRAQRESSSAHVASPVLESVRSGSQPTKNSGISHCSPHPRDSRNQQHDSPMVGTVPLVHRD